MNGKSTRWTTWRDACERAPRLSRAAALAALLASFAAAANEMHDIVSKESEPSRRKMFAAMLNRVGEACLDVTRTYFRGFDKRGVAYWAVSCEGGKDVSVSLSDQGNGTIRALDCRTLEKLTKTKCFSKF